MRYQCRIRRLAASWDNHLHDALCSLLQPYWDVPKQTLRPFAPIPPSAN